MTQQLGIGNCDWQKCQNVTMKKICSTMKVCDNLAGHISITEYHSSTMKYTTWNLFYLMTLLLHIYRCTVQRNVAPGADRIRGITQGPNTGCGAVYVTV